MPLLETKNFGSVPYEETAVLHFPAGLPGFEDSHRFLGLRFPDTDPLVFLQSADDASLCFIAMPIQAIEPEYRLSIEPEDLARLGFEEGRQPVIGQQVLCLALLSIREDGPTANLLAPVVINLANQKAVQAVAADSGYSHQHCLFAQEAAVCS